MFSRCSCRKLLARTGGLLQCGRRPYRTQDYAPVDVSAQTSKAVLIQHAQELRALTRSCHTLLCAARAAACQTCSTHPPLTLGVRAAAGTASPTG